MVAALMVLLVAVAIFWSSIANTAKNRLVQSMEINILPEGKAIFLNKTIIADSVQAFIGNPIGKNANEVNIRKLEGQLNKIPAVKKAEVYLGLDGLLKLKVEERTPILFVQNNKGQQFYVDTNGVVIPNTPSTKFCDVLVANGNIPVIMEGGKIVSGEITRNVMQVAKFVSADSVWNAQFQQLYVDNYNDILLIPKVGNHTIVFGSAEGLEDKFTRLKTFYFKGLNNIGWNKYKSINVKYDNQIIAEKNGFFINSKDTAK